MTGWSVEDLAMIGNAQEFEIASRRPDGSLRPYVTIWGVRHGDELYVRSAYGYENPWFQRPPGRPSGSSHADTPWALSREALPRRQGTV